MANLVELWRFALRGGRARPEVFITELRIFAMEPGEEDMSHMRGIILAIHQDAT